MPVLFVMAAAATFYTAGDLKRDCSPSGAIEACFGFLGGTHDTSSAYQQWMDFREYCLPESGMSKADIRDATLRYLDLHPGNEDALAASIVILALKERYPCARIEFPKNRIDPGAAAKRPADETASPAPPAQPH